MKKLKFSAKTFAKKLWNDESGQGTAEYILLIAIVVGVLVIFGPAIKTKMTDKWNSISSEMDQVAK